MDGPDTVCSRVTLTSTSDSAELMNRVRARCHGRDWSGPRDLLIGTVKDDCFVVRRAPAFKTPVRCVVRGEVVSMDHGSLVTLHFGPQLLRVLAFCFLPVLLPIGALYRIATIVLLVAITFVLFARELRATRRLIEPLLAGSSVPSRDS